MSALISADIHLDSKPRNAERWKLLPWLAEQAREMGCEDILLLGDLTDAKDNHSGELVNRFAEQADALGQEFNLVMLAGNHDGIDPAHPFMSFLNRCRGSVILVQGVPKRLKLSIGDCIFLPSTKDPEQDWAKLNFAEYDYAFAHQTFDGARTENGTILPGVRPGILDEVRKRAYSGDIHVPQLFGKKGVYIGAPYRVKFGDQFEPRVLLVETTSKGAHQQQDMHFPSRGRYMVEIRNAHKEVDPLAIPNVPNGAQVKVRVELPRASLPDWPEVRQRIKDYATKHDWELFGPELFLSDSRGSPVRDKGADSPLSHATVPRSRFEQFCVAKSIDEETITAGLAILDKVSRAAK